jgi:2-polyprenyl-6-hydroxyphenyl methylase/3-demethylubiquinone-9 3-methyltransferase
MESYYAERLSGSRLKQCYDIAAPRIIQYLDAELSHVLEQLDGGHSVLELGCGYGRILGDLAQKARFVVGIDISLESLQLGRNRLSRLSNCFLVSMDATSLAFPAGVFDQVVCIQNGISAFHVNQRDLVRESIRVAKRGGLVLFSSYSPKFWGARLEWFELQSEAGLVGPIDYEKTGNGSIVCKDGFAATTVLPDQFVSLVADLNVKTEIIEVDGSSLFYQITV